MVKTRLLRLITIVLPLPQGLRKADNTDSVCWPSTGGAERGVDDPPSMRMPRPTCGSNCSPSLKRSEEHTSELQSLMRISYAVFCLKKTKKQHKRNHRTSRNCTIQKIRSNTDGESTDT